MGDTPHSIVLQSLLMELGIRAKAWKIRVLPIHRVQVGEGRSHLCDVCVVEGDRPLPEALSAPPLLCIEIVSPEDGASAMNQKLEDYLDAGVKVVWEIDPIRRRAYEMVNGGSKQTDTLLTVPGTEIMVYASEIFRGLEEFNPNFWLKSHIND